MSKATTEAGKALNEARQKALTPTQRTAIAKTAAKTRWKDHKKKPK